MARAKQPVSVGGIEFDALIDSEEQYESEVPEYPTEKGFKVSDTIVLKATVLNLTLFVTDTPVTWKSRLGSGPGKTEAVVKRLKDMYFGKQVVEVVTSDEVYPNMAITSLSIKKTAEVGYAREIPISLKEIVVTSTKTVGIPSSYGKSGTTGASAGTANTRAGSSGGSGSGGGSGAGSSSGSGSGNSGGSGRSGSILYNAASSFGLL